LQQYCAEYVVH